MKMRSIFLSAFNKLAIISAYIAITSLFFACSDIFEEDIESDIISLNTPPDSAIVSDYQVSFWWSELEGADSYRLMVVSPDFQNPQRLILDTTITLNLFLYTLEPGNYQWRVTGMNSAYETKKYNTYTFTIDTTSDISHQNVLLRLPSDSYATNQMTVFFKWDSLYAASDYAFKIKEQSWGGSTNFDTTLYQNSIYHQFSEEGTYAWGVMAENNVSTTLFTYRTLLIDTTDPLPSEFDYPAQGDTVTEMQDSTMTILWGRNSDSGSAYIGDSVFIYSSTLSTYVLESYTTSEYLLFSPDTTGVFEIFLRTSDLAGNWSSYSNVAYILVQ